MCGMKKTEKWYFVSKIDLTYCEKKIVLKNVQVNFVVNTVCTVLVLYLRRNLLEQSLDIKKNF